MDPVLLCQPDAAWFHALRYARSGCKKPRPHTSNRYRTNQQTQTTTVCANGMHGGKNQQIQTTFTVQSHKENLLRNHKRRMMKGAHCRKGRTEGKADLATSSCLAFCSAAALASRSSCSFCCTSPLASLNSTWSFSTSDWELARACSAICALSSSSR